MGVRWLTAFTGVAGISVVVMTLAALAVAGPDHTANHITRPAVQNVPIADRPLRFIGGAMPKRTSTGATRLGGPLCAAGLFDPPRLFFSGGAPTLVVAGNLDEDLGAGPIDVAVAAPNAFGGANGGVLIFRNRGNLNGVWQGLEAVAVAETGASPTDMTTGRISGPGGQDAVEDLIICNNGEDTVEVAIFDGGALNITIIASTVDGINDPRGVAALDLDGDERDDIAVTNAGNDTVSTFLCPCGGLPLAASGGPMFTFGGQVNVDPGPEDIEPEDIDNDKDIDLIISNINGGRVQVIRNTTVAAFGGGGGGGGGGLIPEAPIDVGQNPMELVFRDFDGDSLPDVVTADTGADQSTKLGNVGGMLGVSGVELVDTAPRSVASGDFTGDGLPDLVFVADTDLGRSIAVLCNNGGLDFGAATPISVNGTPNFVAVADLDQNGIDDIITANAEGTVSVLLGARDLTCLADCAPPPVGNGVVNIDDLLNIINAISTQDLACDIAPDMPTVGNGVVNIDDLLAAISSFGDCPAPLGDGCADGPIVIGGGPDLVEVITVDTSRADTDGPAHPECDQFGSGDTQIFNDIWLCYTAPCGTVADPAQLTFSLAGSNFDTKMAVYDGCSCPTDGISLLACNDDANGTVQSEITLAGILSGDDILIRIGGFAPSDRGAAMLTITCADEPLGACCDGSSCIGTMAESQCSAMAPDAVWVADEDCLSFTCDPGCINPVFSNGLFDCVNGSAPAVGIGGWMQNGIIEDFELTVNTTLTGARFDWLQNINPGAPTGFVDYRIRIYDLTNITLSALDFVTTPPVATFDTDVNDLTKSIDPTVCFAGFATEIVQIDLTDQGATSGIALSAGRYAIYIQVADAPNSGGLFWATAPGNVAGPENGRIFGPGGINSDAGNQFAFLPDGHPAVRVARGRFVVLREHAITSGRKLRTHSRWELLGMLMRLIFRGRRGVQSREGLDLWYGERRPDTDDAQPGG